MKMLVKFALVLALATLGFGCVAQSQYDRLRTAYLSEQEQNVNLKDRLDEAYARIKALQDAKQASADAELQSKLEQALADKDRLAKMLSEMEARLRAAGMNNEVALPAALDTALRDLAAQYPGLMTYDPKRGMVKFAADLTFDLGSDQVKPNAAAALAKLAGVIASPAAAQFEALVVGHTDNVRIARPQTKAKFPTNWHLSVFRSISVKDVLQKSGVQPNRFCVAGYGEYRPIVPNQGSRGAEANRRVEIFLVSSTASSIDVGPSVEISEPASASTDVVAPAPASTKKPATIDTPELYK